MNSFQMLDCFTINGHRIIEYVTRHGVRRFDTQPWKGESTVRIPFENENGTWEVKEYQVEIWAAPSRVNAVHTMD